MEDRVFEVVRTERIAYDVYRTVIEGTTTADIRPGQFINIKLDGLYLRRPISICDCVGSQITIIYKTVGEGTEKMSEAPVGTEWDVLVGLGNGFDVSKCKGDTALLVGGGVGVPPMYMLCKQLLAAGKRVIVVCGFASRGDVFYEEEFKRLGAEVHIATANGTYGKKGFVTDVIKELSGYDYFYACGPIPMFRAMEEVVVTDGQYSFEERMGCGFGACMGCSCETKYGNKRICRDGPVLDRGEVIW